MLRVRVIVCVVILLFSQLIVWAVQWGATPGCLRWWLVLENSCLVNLFTSELLPQSACRSTSFALLLTSVSQAIGHFRVTRTLTLKMRPSAQPFLWKWVLLAWEWKIISISKVEHFTSFRCRGLEELGNGLLTTLTPNHHHGLCFAYINFCFSKAVSNSCWSCCSNATVERSSQWPISEV